MFTMDLFVLKIVFVIAIFLAVIIFCLLPILILRTYAENAGFVCVRLLSWCNCLTGGLFLALCFLGLLPNVQEQTVAVLQGLHVSTNFPLAECIVLLGFFIVLAIDQASRCCERPKHPTRKVFEMDSLGINGYGSPGELDDDAQRTLLYDDDEEITASPVAGDARPYGDVSEDGIGINVHSGRREATKSGDRRIAPGDRQQPSGGGHHSHEHVLDLIEATPHGLRFLVLLFALSMHALFEGIVLGLQQDVPKAVHLFTAIILHEAVVAATLGFNIAKAKHSVWTAVRYSLIFSVTIPIGIGLGMGLGQTPGVVGHIVSGSLQGVAAGIFLHITFMQLLPAEFARGNDGLVKTLFLFIGFLLLMTLNLALGVKH